MVWRVGSRLSTRVCVGRAPRSGSQGGSRFVVEWRGTGGAGMLLRALLRTDTSVDTL